MAQTVSSAVARRDEGPISLMWSRKRHFDAVLPQSVDVEAFLGTAAGALYASPKLMEAAVSDPDSLIVAMMHCAALGHQPGTDEYYLTPRKDKGKPKVLGIEGYRGVIERMYRSGAVAKVVVREVCANDKFSYVEGRDDKPVHEIGGRGTTGADFFTGQNRGEMVGVYAYAELMTGAISRVVILTRDDVYAARDSGGYKPDDTYSPWNRMDGGKDHPEFRGRAMWWKTGAKRLEPWVPTSAEFRREQLRAAAAASDAAGPRVVAPAGAASPPPDMDIHDAEIVDDHAASDQVAKQEPPARQGSSQRPTGAAIGKLGNLLIQLGMGTPEDQAVMLPWLTGRDDAAALDTLTRDETARITKVLGDVLRSHGDPESAAAMLWARYHEDTAPASGQDSDGEASDA